MFYLYCYIVCFLSTDVLVDVFFNKDSSGLKSDQDTIRGSLDKVSVIHTTLKFHSSFMDYLCCRVNPVSLIHVIGE